MRVKNVAWCFKCENDDQDIDCRIEKYLNTFRIDIVFKFNLTSVKYLQVQFASRFIRLRE